MKTLQVEKIKFQNIFIIKEMFGGDTGLTGHTVQCTHTRTRIELFGNVT